MSSWRKRSFAETLHAAVDSGDVELAAGNNHAVPDRRAVEFHGASLLAGLDVHHPELRAALAFERGGLFGECLLDRRVLRGEALEGVFLIERVRRTADEKILPGERHGAGDDGHIRVPLLLDEAVLATAGGGGALRATGV